MKNEIEDLQIGLILWMKIVEELEETVIELEKSISDKYPKEKYN